MKILYDYQGLTLQKYGGISRYFFELAERINQYDGVELKVAGVFSFNYYFRNYIHMPMWKKKVLSHYPQFSDHVNKLAVCLNSFRADIIHPMYYDPYILSGHKKGKLVVTIHDMIYEIYGNQMKDAEQVIQNKKAHVFAADHIIAVSECTKKDILRFYPEIPEEKITVIYHGNSLVYSHDNFVPVDLPDHYILFMGQRGLYKNFNLFVEAASRLMKNDPTLHIVAGGGGPFSDEEKALLDQLGIANRVIQIGYTDEQLPTVYHNAEFFVFPSKYEGFGIPILEAWACECPICISDASCFPEVAKDAALYFNPESADEIECAMKELLSNDILKKELISKGTKYLKEYNWDKTAAETFEVYKKIGKK